MNGVLAFLAAVVILLALTAFVAVILYKRLPLVRREALHSSFASKRAKEFRAGAFLALAASLLVLGLSADEWEGSLVEYLTWLSAMYIPLAAAIAAYVTWMKRKFPDVWKQMIRYEQVSLPGRVWVGTITAVLLGLLPTFLLAARMP